MASSKIEWYYLVEEGERGSVQGPLSEAGMEKLFEQGILRADSAVRESTTGVWRRADEVFAFARRRRHASSGLRTFLGALLVVCAILLILFKIVDRREAGEVQRPAAPQRRGVEGLRPVIPIDRTPTERRPTRGDEPLPEGTRGDRAPGQEAQPQAPTETAMPAPVLTKPGIIALTNKAREEQQLKALHEDALLDDAAEERVRDMFQKQYWAHTSPSGEEASDSVSRTGYRYRTIGENIAMGNFTNDEKLVKGWLQSPGHRANIMNRNHEDIGTAVQRGAMKGEDVWIAVQIFGSPSPEVKRSAAGGCVRPDESLLKLIRDEEQTIDELSARARGLRQEIEQEETMTARSPAFVNNHNTKVREYNELAAYLRGRNSAYQRMVERYNQEVTSYNACARK